MEEFPQTFSMQNIASGSIIANRYEVKEKIGSGGMGLVFKVLDRHLNNETVALKLLHPHLAQDDEVFARFQNEVLVARSLSHPNIVRLHDMGRAEQGFSYISMEYVNGYSLNERISKKQNKREGIPKEPLEFSEAISILVRLLSGVAYAHGKGIIHRDLKPANVMISSDDEVKLADFGTARIVGMTAGLTQTGQTIGTPDYMSPEQIQGLELDAATDIYSLGIIGYELLVGEKPFIADSAVAVAFKHMHEPIPNFADESKGIPQWFEDVIKKATAKDKADRFESAYQFAEKISLHAPDSLSKGTFFLSDRTMFHGSATSTAIKRSIETEIKDGETDSAEFVLGKKATSAPGKKEVDGWSFGEAGSSAVRRESQPIVEAKKKPTSGVFRNIILIAASVALFLGGLTASALFVPGVGESVVGTLRKLEKQSGFDLSGLVNFVGVPDSEQMTTNSTESVEAVVSNETVSDEERDKLAEELLLAAAGGEIPTEEKNIVEKTPAIAAETPADSKPEVSVAPEKGAEKTAEKVASAVGIKTAEESADSKPPESQPEVTAKVESQEKTEEENTEVVEAVKPPPPVLVKAQQVAFRMGSRVNSSASLLSNELGRTSWDAEVSGLTGSSKRVLRELVAQDFSANIVLASEGKLIKKLPVELRKSKGKEALLIGGNLRGLASATDMSVGEYRLDLIRKGEVLSSTPFSLSKANVVVKPNPSSLAGGNIAIVRGPTYKPATKPLEEPVKKEPESLTQPLPQSSLTAEETKPVVSEAPLKAAEPEFQALIPPSSGGSLPQIRSNDTGTSSLPPARRLPGIKYQDNLHNSEFNVSSIDLAKQGNLEKSGDVLSSSSALTQPSVPAVVRERFIGVFSVKNEGSGQEQDRSMELRLSFADNTISGEADIEGYERFAVDGKVFPRGMEMTLRGQSTAIRLSGVKRGDSMRGRYFIPSQKLRGSWKAAK